VKITTKHASDSPVTFVTHERFAVLFFLPSCCVNSLLLSAISSWAKGKVGCVNLFLVTGSMRSDCYRCKWRGLVMMKVIILVNNRKKGRISYDRWFMIHDQGSYRFLNSKFKELFHFIFPDSRLSNRWSIETFKTQEQSFFHDVLQNTGGLNKI